MDQLKLFHPALMPRGWDANPGGIELRVRADFMTIKEGLTMATEPNLTFYYGQEITDIVPEGDGWAIVLESGVRIVNLDAEYDMPDNSLVGMFVSKAAFGAGLTALYAGPKDNPMAAQVSLNPTQYGIDDNTYSDELFIPQDSSTAEKGAAMDQYEEQLAARQAEGPSQEFLDAAAQADPELQPDAEAPENAAEAVADEDGPDAA